MLDWSWITSLFGNGLEDLPQDGNLQATFVDLFSYVYVSAIVPFGAVMFTLWGLVYLPQWARRVFCKSSGIGAE